MSTLHPGDSVVIGRVRLHSSTRGDLAEQRKLSGLLSNASLLPSRLPSGSLLCIRSITDPSPGRQPLESDRVYLLPAWELAVAQLLDRQAAEAVRPALVQITSSVNAVLFLDDAEILACLAADWLSGALPRNWWWRQILRSFDCGAVVHQWLRACASVPAALELLSSGHRAERFVAQLPNEVASELLRLVLLAHGISAFGPNPDEQLARQSTNTATQEQTHPSGGFLSIVEKQVAPWSRWITDPVKLPDNSIQQQLFVQSLMLSRAPAVVRTVEFQSQLSAWFARKPALVQTKAEQSQEIDPAADLVREENAEAIDGNAEQSDSSTSASARKAGAPRLDRQSHSLQDSTHIDREDSVTREGQNSNRTNGSQSNSNLDQQAERTNPAPQAASTTADPKSPEGSDLLGSGAEAKSEHRSTAQGIGGQRVETRFGGVFFLLNVALALEFYPDFSRPLDPSLDVNIWDFLAILGDRFTQGELRSDPVWKILAQLAGRDAPEDPGTQNPWLLAPNETWIDTISLQVSGFLNRSLDVENAVEVLCCLPASVTATPTHVDVFYSMQTHPIEIRIACLDRDPGWIPAAGRYVAYHFD